MHCIESLSVLTTCNGVSHTSYIATRHAVPHWSFRVTSDRTTSIINVPAFYLLMWVLRFQDEEFKQSFLFIYVWRGDGNLRRLDEGLGCVCASPIHGHPFWIKIRKGGNVYINVCESCDRVHTS